VNLTQVVEGEILGFIIVDKDALDLFTTPTLHIVMSDAECISIYLHARISIFFVIINLHVFEFQAFITTLGELNHCHLALVLKNKPDRVALLWIMISDHVNILDYPNLIFLQFIG
jgi:hypothetical protein